MNYSVNGLYVQTFRETNGDYGFRIVTPGGEVLDQGYGEASEALAAREGKAAAKDIRDPRAKKNPKRHATADDFSRWEERAKTMSISALDYSIKDALAAAKAIGSHDPARSGRYMDEAYTYADEKRRRKNPSKKAAPRGLKAKKVKRLGKVSKADMRSSHDQTEKAAAKAWDDFSARSPADTGYRAAKARWLKAEAKTRRVGEAVFITDAVRAARVYLGSEALRMPEKAREALRMAARKKIRAIRTADSVQDINIGKQIFDIAKLQGAIRPVKKKLSDTHKNPAKEPKYLTAAVDAVRLYHGSSGCTPKVQDRLAKAAQRKIAAVHKAVKSEDYSIAEQIFDAAKRRGAIIPRPGKDY